MKYLLMITLLLGGCSLSLQDRIQDLKIRSVEHKISSVEIRRQMDRVESGEFTLSPERLAEVKKKLKRNYERAEDTAMDAWMESWCLIVGRKYIPKTEEQRKKHWKRYWKGTKYE